jgi:hypothetical protein
MKSFLLFAASIVGSGILIFVVALSNTKNEIPEKHIEVVLRDIGHRLLLSAKDSSSRVLPIKQLNEDTYQIAFQTTFSVIADTLMNIVKGEFQQNPLAKDYIVNLKNCTQQETVLAFEINNQTSDLTPCNGRTLDVGCYVIEIHFLRATPISFFWLLLLLVPLGVIGVTIKNKFWKKEDSIPTSDNTNFIPLGNYKFYATNYLLTIEDRSTTLSEKETKALKIFAENINQIVERELLMKTIWEDEGIVVISRNVDVLVSKLRKKLSDDKAIKLINIHGKGYKLMLD